METRGEEHRGERNGVGIEAINAGAFFRAKAAAQIAPLLGGSEATPRGDNVDEPTIALSRRLFGTDGASIVAQRGDAVCKLPNGAKSAEVPCSGTLREAGCKRCLSLARISLSSLDKDTQLSQRAKDSRPTKS